MRHVDETDILCAVQASTAHEIDPKHQQMLDRCVDQGWVRAYTAYALTDLGAAMLSDAGIEE